MKTGTANRAMGMSINMVHLLSLQCGADNLSTNKYSSKISAVNRPGFLIFRVNMSVYKAVAVMIG